jgi:hypothetical protein
LTPRWPKTAPSGRAEIIDLIKRLNIATDGTMHFDAEYLVVITTKNR